MTVTPEQLERLGALSTHERWSDLSRAARRALAADPEHPEVWSHLATALFYGDDRRAALDALEHACALNPDNAWLFRIRSLCLQTLDRLHESFAIAQIAMELAPHDAASHIRVSRLAQLTGDAARAHTAAERARELAPDDWLVWQNLGWNASKEHRWSDACEHYRRALALSPEEAMLHDALGAALKWLDRRAEAAACYRRAIACDPRRTAPYTELAQLRFEDGDEDEAFALLRRACEAAPKSVDVRYTLIDKLLQYDFDAEALALARATVDAFPKTTNALCVRARCEERVGDLAAAEAACARAVELEPGASYTRIAHAHALDALGEHDRAIARAREATATRGGDPSYWSTLIAVLRHAGRIDDALAVAQDVIASHPNVGFLWGDLARVHLARGDVAEARRAATELLARRPKILRNWNLAARIAGLAGDLAQLRDVERGVRALPVEKSRFGNRLLREAAAQCTLFAAIIEERWPDAEVAILAELDDASRVDEYACTLVCALGVVWARTGRTDEARGLAGRAPVGRHATRHCGYRDCGDRAALDRALVATT